LLAVAGFRPGGRPTFFLSRQKESRQRKRRFLFGQPAADARPSGPLAPVWRLEAVARSTEQPTAKPRCAELVLPSAGEPAQGWVVQRAGAPMNHRWRKWPAERVSNRVGQIQGPFSLPTFFLAPQKESRSPAGAKPGKCKHTTCAACNRSLNGFESTSSMDRLATRLDSSSMMPAQ
jgi:hypothetical protein